MSTAIKVFKDNANCKYIILAIKNKIKEQCYLSIQYKQQ